MAPGYPSKSKIRSHFIKPFMMNKTTFHTGAKGGGDCHHPLVTTPQYHKFVLVAWETRIEGTSEVIKVKRSQRVGFAQPNTNERLNPATEIKHFIGAGRFCAHVL